MYGWSQGIYWFANLCIFFCLKIRFDRIRCFVGSWEYFVWHWNNPNFFFTTRIIIEHSASCNLRLNNVDRLILFSLWICPFSSVNRQTFIQLFSSGCYMCRSDHSVSILSNEGRVCRSLISWWVGELIYISRATRFRIKLISLFEKTLNLNFFFFKFQWKSKSKLCTYNLNKVENTRYRKNFP